MYGSPLLETSRCEKLSTVVNDTKQLGYTPFALFAFAMADEPRSLNFIEEIIEEHDRTGRFGGRVHTRFPPEPNGYLHIGHAKSICLNFGLATEVRRQVQSAVRRHESDQGRAGVRRLDHGRRALARLRLGTALFYASDYFEQLYDWAIKLIKAARRMSAI